MEKLPPLEKIYEAWSALADNRVTIHPDERYAEVRSSDFTKTYHVAWNGDIYTSNDNASYWQGYAGYPVLAVLMLQGRLPYDSILGSRFANIPWKQINVTAKNDYAQAAAMIMTERHIDPALAASAANSVEEAIKKLPVTVKRNNFKS